MKITIDTKADSPEDIQKVIQILSHFASREPLTNFEPVDTTNMMNMFDTSPTSTKEKKEVPDTPPDFSSFTSLLNKKGEKKESLPKIQFF